jgi:hypothetical protein
MYVEGKNRNGRQRRHLSMVHVQPGHCCSLTQGIETGEIYLNRIANGDSFLIHAVS